MTRPASDTGGAASNSAMGPRAVADVIEEIRARFCGGKRARAEDYVDPADPASSDPDRVLDLVYAEYLVRCETEVPPSVTELAARFPHLANRIQRQISLHEALESDAETMSDGGNPPALIHQTVSADENPALIGRYRVITPLGRGGQATVYRGLHPELRRDVVIKLAHRTAGPQEVESLRAEARLLASLDHPGLARVYDLDFHDGQPFIVMEYVGGRPLDVEAAAAPIPPTLVAELVAQAALAVAHAHRQGAIHRDLKPENVLVDDAGRVRVIDFGVAKLMGPGAPSPGAEGSITGTLRYMAPEQARGEVATVSARADVFGLGGILYFLLTGSPLYPGPTLEALNRATVGDWDRSKLETPTIPSRLRAVCEKALAPDPADRYPSADALAAALGDARRRPWRPIAVAAAGLLVTGLVVGGWWLANRESQPFPPQPAINVRVWDDNQERYRELVHMLPLSTGERLRYEAAAPAGRHLALFAIDPAGEVRALTSLPPQANAGTINYPTGPNQRSDLVAPSGTVIVLLCGREEGPVTADDVHAALGTDKWPRLPKNSVVVVEREKVFVKDTSRTVGPPTDQPDPEADVLRRLDTARTRLGQKYDIIAGVAFSHRD